MLHASVQSGAYLCIFFSRVCAFLRVSVRFFLPKWPAEKRKIAHNRAKMCKKHAIPPLVIPPFACHRGLNCTHTLKRQIVLKLLGFFAKGFLSQSVAKWRTPLPKGRFLVTFWSFIFRNSEKSRVRKIRVRNSGAGNGCANFMGTWKMRSFCRKTCVHKIPRFGGGGGFRVLGGGGVPILFLWARGFF